MLHLRIIAPEWVAGAVCTSVDPELFFPEKGGSNREAKSICGGCPVQVDCLDAALTEPESFGIWGGTSPQERRRLAKRSVRNSTRYETSERTSA